MAIRWSIVTAAYKRFLEGRFRKEFDFGGYTASNRDEDFSNPFKEGEGRDVGTHCRLSHDCSGCALPFVSEG